MKDFGNYALMDGGTILFELSAGSKGMTEDVKTSGSGITGTPKNLKKEIDFFPWGMSNDLPDQLIDKSYKNVTVASNLDFNAKMGCGDTLMLGRRHVTENNELKTIPVLRSDPKAKEIFDFIDDNNINLLIQEQVHDQVLLHNGFVEFIFNNDRKKIVRMLHKEATYSRLSVIDEKTGNSEYHGYSAKWGENRQDEDLIATPLLDYDAPLYDLKRRMGLIPDSKGKRKDEKQSRYVMHIAQPSPGRFYYQKAYWWAIFESFWYDFSCAIPEFKYNLLKNQLTLKYHVMINRKFFSELFKSEGITDPEKQNERRLQFYRNMEDFLAGKENAGKNLVSNFEYDMSKGVEQQDIIIKPIESFIKGGEYIEDSEEATNMISNAMGVHPSLQGASPGKNKTINGTEARELFIIKQSMMKPMRDLLLQPLYIVKAVNGWDPDIDFFIPNIQLTTLDKNTGAEKSIGNQKV